MPSHSALVLLATPPMSFEILGDIEREKPKQHTMRISSKAVLQQWSTPEPVEPCVAAEPNVLRQCVIAEPATVL
jgi:hypothetical protein